MENPNDTTNHTTTAHAKRGPKAKAPELVRQPSGLLINATDRQAFAAVQVALDIKSRNDTLAHCIKAANALIWAEVASAAIWRGPQGWVVQLPDSPQTAPAPTLLGALAHARALHG